MATSTYRIEDEPRPGAWAHLAVNPLWPMLGLMLGGFVFGLVWFIVNGIAVGSPTRVKDAWIAALGLAGALILSLAWAVGDGMGYLPDAAGEYAVLPLMIWKLSIAYRLFDWQNRTIQIHEYFGGKLRNGLPIVAGAAILRGAMIQAVPYTIWQLVVS